MRRVKNILGYGLVVVFIIWTIYFANDNLDILSLISTINFGYFLPLIFLICLNYFFISWINKILLTSFNIDINHLTSFGLSLSTGFYNLLIPFRGGMFARGYYLKSKYTLPYSSFVANVSAVYIFTYWFSSIFGLVCILVIFITRGIINWYVCCAYIITFLSLGYLVFFTPRFTETQNSFVNRIIQVINDWKTISTNRRVIRQIAVISIARLLTTGFTAWLYYWSFGIKLQYIEGLFMAITTSFSMLINITPAGLGIVESFSIFSAQVVGISMSQSLPVVLFGRALSLLVLLLLGSIASYFLYKTFLFNKQKKL